jgi:phosphatidylserine/phosphatidylglycerophosphate/cardiolipin synthase-like enzyme
MTKKQTRKQTPSSRFGAFLAAVIVIIAAVVSLFQGTPEGEMPPVSPTPRPGTPVAVAPGAAAPIAIPQGFGAEMGFWQVYFTAPTGSSDRALYVNGIDTALAAAINAARGTIDIAAFEFNNPVLTQAVLDAHRRGVKVRMVTDNEHGLNDDDTTIGQFTAAGIPVVDDGRSALMHNKFMIIDSTTVWTGSWNYTINDTYRNNNNAVALRSRRAVQSYQAEFDEMFTRREFGPRSSIGNAATFTQDGTPIRILFAPEDDVLSAIISELEQANRSIRFMAFSFTVAQIGDLIQNKAAAGVQVQGIYETTGSQTEFSTLRPLFCAGLAVRQDGNRYILHHKVFILDDQTVITGSFNFSANATRSNDENLVIIRDAVLAAQYIAEFERRWAEARTPQSLTCS